MVNAHFEFRGLTRAQIGSGCSFKNADFRWADLTGIDFGDGDLCGANFDHAMIAGADLARARADGLRELASAYADAATKPPKPLRALKFSHLLPAEADAAERQRWVEAWQRDRTATEEADPPSASEEG